MSRTRVGDGPLGCEQRDGAEQSTTGWRGFHRIPGSVEGHWRWTGFTGNTAWDWLHLLLLPLLVPAVIVPLLRPMVAGRFEHERASDV